MIGRLRKNFVIIAMLSTLLVLVLLIGSIQVINYHDILQNADELLSLLAENGGSFLGVSGEPKEPPEKPLPDKEDKENKEKRVRWSEETPFETRYFAVQYDSEGQILQTQTDHIAAVSQEEAESYADEILASGKTKGFYSRYRYLVAEQEGGTLILFVDCGRLLDNFYTFFLTCVGVSALGLLLVFLLVFFFSKIVFRPVLESDQKQKTFITDASHELKTPLTIIDANTEVLEMMNGENEFTRSIRNQVSRLTHLTNQMVTLTRLDEGRQTGTVREFSFGETTAEIADSFSLVARSKGKRFLAEIDERIKVTGDEERLSQLVSLLLDNAVKYSDQEGNIRICLYKKGKKTILQVSNTAQELPDGNLDILFERFYRADSSRNSKTGGSGIGLSVAKAIVLAHRGSIHAEKTDDRTILFTVTL